MSWSVFDETGMFIGTATENADGCLGLGCLAVCVSVGGLFLFVPAVGGLILSQLLIGPAVALGMPERWAGGFDFGATWLGVAGFWVGWFVSRKLAPDAGWARRLIIVSPIYLGFWLTGGLLAGYMLT